MHTRLHTYGDGDIVRVCSGVQQVQLQVSVTAETARPNSEDSKDFDSSTAGLFSTHAVRPVGAIVPTSSSRKLAAKGSSWSSAILGSTKLLFWDWKMKPRGLPYIDRPRVWVKMETSGRVAAGDQVKSAWRSTRRATFVNRGSRSTTW